MYFHEQRILVSFIREASVLQHVKEEAYAINQ